MVTKDGKTIILRCCCGQVQILGQWFLNNKTIKQIIEKNKNCIEIIISICPRCKGRAERY